MRQEIYVEEPFQAKCVEGSLNNTSLILLKGSQYEGLDGVGQA